MARAEVSLIIAAKNEGDNLVDTVAGLLEGGASPSLEIIVVDDGSSDGSGERTAARFRDDDRVSVHRADEIGVAAARNLGARHGSGEFLVFLDAHCWCPKGWIERLLAPLADPRVGLTGPAFLDLVRDDGGIGCGVVWPRPDLQMAWLAPHDSRPAAVPLMPGGCDALRRELFERIGGYDEGMGSWGSEGEELSLRVWSFGFEVQGVPECRIRHLFRARHPYAVDTAEVLHNRLRMAVMHFPRTRMQAVLNACHDAHGNAAAVAQLLTGDAAMRRSRRTSASRRHVAAWFDRFITTW